MVIIIRENRINCVVTHCKMDAQYAYTCMYIAADQEKDSSYSNIIMQNDCRGMNGNSFEGGLTYSLRGLT